MAAMGDKENRVGVRLLRAATKRVTPFASASAAAAATNPPAKRKRVALSQIPIRPNTRDSKSKKQRDLRLPLAPPASSFDLDSEADDPQLCSPYASDILHYLRSMEEEQKRRPRVDYIEKVHTDVTAKMRGMLVDWLVEVAEEYKLVPDTLYLAISYIDRFLSTNAISRQKLQLLGVSAMLLASKYEEISPPHVDDFCYITDNTYSKKDVVKMEADVLKFLKFEMGNPTINTFLSIFTRAAQLDGKYPDLQLQFLGCYLAELSLLDYACVGFLPSVAAASAVFVARFTLNPKINPWTKELQEFTGYQASDLKECICAIHELQLNKRWPSLVAVREKYNEHRFKCVASTTSPDEIPASFFDDLKE